MSFFLFNQFFYNIYKINVRCIIDIKFKYKIIQFLEENFIEYFYEFGMGKDKVLIM